MANINLLPWRENLRERRNKEFITLLVISLLLGLALAFAAWSYFNTVLTDQQMANDYITAENVKLDAELAEIETLEQRREDIISRMQVIQDLQGKRPLPVRVWDDVAKAIPEAMYLIVLERAGDTLTFTGKAANPNVVSALVRNLDASNWLSNSKVVVIKQDVNAYASDNEAVTSEDEVVMALPEDSYIDFIVTTQVSNQIGDIAGDDQVDTDLQSSDEQAQLLNPPNESNISGGRHG